MKNITNTTKIVLSSIVAIAVIGSTFGYNEIIALDNEYQFDQSEMPHYDVISQMEEYEIRNSDENFSKFSTKALSDPDLKLLGPEWKVLSVDVSGTMEPFEVTTATVFARLVDNVQNVRQCEFGTEVTIVYDIKTGEVLEKIIPEVDVCEKPLELGKMTDTADVPSFIPQAFATSTRAYLTAEQGSPSGHHMVDMDISKYQH